MVDIPRRQAHLIHDVRGTLCIVSPRDASAPCRPLDGGGGSQAKKGLGISRAPSSFFASELVQRLRSCRQTR